ncbi:MAG: hypothetical protein QME60_08460 [Verrucomicrobiota bacterium]|nr:hypothetical protein [Verrucomicrobiota bacterium]
MNTTPPPDMQDVIRAEIDVLRKEADAGVQAYYASKTIHDMIRDDDALHSQLNTNGYFWATALYGLQCVFFLSLRKFFDLGGRSHRFDKLIALCEEHVTVFSRESLARRREKDFKTCDELKSCVAKAFVPERGYFQQFQAQVSAELDRLKYRDVYRAVGDKIIAHNEIVRHPKIDNLFADTDMKDAEAILLLMQRIATGFWSLWTNGYTPDLSATRFPLSELVAGDARNALSARKQMEGRNIGGPL